MCECAIGLAFLISAYHPGPPRPIFGNSKQFMNNLLADESGQDLIEYALVAALVALGSVAAMGGLANVIKNTFNSIGSSLTNAA